jgi:Glycosyltransferase family 87
MTRVQLKELNFLGWIFFAALFLITVHQSADRNQPRDFVYFYSDGQILNQYSPNQLYDFSIQKKTFDRVFPIKEGEYGPSPYPPYVAMSFRPLALLPFWTAYRLWISVSMVLYLTGVLILVGRSFPGDRMRQSILCCFSLLFWPFIACTLLNGQLSTIAFLALACAICLDDASHPYLAGMALGVCAYKPTLLILLIPMLFVTRRVKVLCGFAAVVSALFSITTILEGPGIWLSYIRFSVEFAHIKGLVLSDYVDLTAVSHALGHYSPVLAWLTISLAAVFLSWLLWIWILGAQIAQRLPATLIWGTTITWTLLLNVYVPQYDTILVIVSIIVTAAALKNLNYRAFVATSVAILICSYGTRQIAERSGVQILSLLLIVLGTLQMVLCFRTANSRVTVPSDPHPYTFPPTREEIDPILTATQRT